MADEGDRDEPAGLILFADESSSELWLNAEDAKHTRLDPLGGQSLSRQVILRRSQRQNAEIHGADRVEGLVLFLEGQVLRY